MKDQESLIDSISNEAKSGLEKASNSKSLYDVKVKYFGKKGRLSSLMKQMKDLPPEKRPEMGARLNALKKELESIFESKMKRLRSKERLKEISKGFMDLTGPGPDREPGAFHPIEQMIQKTTRIFEKLGYILASGPLIETDWYNFSALNIPPEHPSRDIHDTFYLDRDRLLRTHTSPVQIRSLEKIKPPMAIAAPGLVFRRDHPDASHSPCFHQIEGLLIDRNVSMGHLKGTLSYFLKELYGSKTKLRFRPSFFPFTEPSAEYDSSCFLCEGRGCSLCKKSGWIEMGGAGLVHPHVLESVKLSPNKWQGFAFGMGIDRLALQEYRIPDIRFFYENRIDFLKQFEDR